MSLKGLQSLRSLARASRRVKDIQRLCCRSSSEEVVDESETNAQTEAPRSILAELLGSGFWRSYPLAPVTNILVVEEDMLSSKSSSLQYYIFWNMLAKQKLCRQSRALSTASVLDHAILTNQNPMSTLSATTRLSDRVPCHEKAAAALTQYYLGSFVSTPACSGVMASALQPDLAMPAFDRYNDQETTCTFPVLCSKQTA